MQWYIAPDIIYSRRPQTELAELRQYSEGLSGVILLSFNIVILITKHSFIAEKSETVFLSYIFFFQTHEKISK